MKNERNKEFARLFRESGATYTYQEDAVICPWCGAKYAEDLSEWEDYGDMICDVCGKSFQYEIEIKIECSTERIYDDEQDNEKTD